MSEIKVAKAKFVITSKESKKVVPSSRKESSVRAPADEPESTWTGLSFEESTITTGLSRDWLVTCEDDLYSRKKK